MAFTACPEFPLSEAQSRKGDSPEHKEFQQRTEAKPPTFPVNAESSKMAREATGTFFWKKDADVDKEKCPFLAFCNYKCLMKWTELNFSLCYINLACVWGKVISKSRTRKKTTLLHSRCYTQYSDSSWAFKKHGVLSTVTASSQCSRIFGFPQSPNCTQPANVVHSPFIYEKPFLMSKLLRSILTGGSTQAIKE